MCGIALTINGSILDVSRMGESIRRRGIHHDVTEIDNIKVWLSWLPIVNQNTHRQPFMAGGWTVWLNGYISNYKELCEKYNIELYTDCDTLLLAEFFKKFGMTKNEELNGFFSIVAYHDRQLHLITDRYGIKQLYKAQVGDRVYVASEVKALLQIIKPELDSVAVADWEYSLGVMTDHTIYKNIEKVEKLPFNKPFPIKIDYEEAKKELKRLFDQSIKRNKASISDGVLLSGGVDSAIIAKHINPDYCFSMDYIDGAFSEIENIKLNSSGVHMTMICNDALFEQNKKRVIGALDDLKVGSCYTNFAITELASKFCTVLYSGAGGDELFDGYGHRYDRDIDDVIRRTDREGPSWNISHKDYDWRFLQGILIVEDRIGGWHTMETRYPLLDNDFVNFALSLPDEYKKNKKILKDISGLHEKVRSGKKRGFSNPHLTNKEWIKLALDETRSLYNCI